MAASMQALLLPLAVVLLGAGLGSLHASDLNSAAADLNISISQDTLNSASQTYTHGGALTFSGKLRDLRGLVVNTTVFKLIVPAAYAACPNCPIDFQLAAAAAPSVSIGAAHGALLSARSALMNLTTRQVGPANVSSTPIFLFMLSVNASAGLVFSHVPAAGGDFIKANITAVASQFSVVRSAFGPATTALLGLISPLLNRFIDTVVVAEFNELFPGIPIPSISGVTLTQVAIRAMAGRLSLSLDLNISKATRSQTAVHSEAPTEGQLQKLPPGFSAPGFVGSVSASGLDKVLQDFLPQIVAEVNSLTVPAMSGKASGVDYSIDAIKLADFKIGGATIGFEAGRGLLLTLSAMSLSVPSTHFEVSKKVLFAHIHCGGHFHGALGGSNKVAMHLNVSATAQGQPHVTPAAQWSWGQLSVSEKMDSTGCKIIQDIAKVFVGSINGKIEDAIKKQIPATVNGLISGQGNTLLQQLVLTKKIDKWAEVNFYMTQNPRSTASQLTLSLSGQFVPVN